MEEEFENFKKLVKPVSNYIKEKYNPHTTIIITDSYAKIVEDTFGVKLEQNELMEELKNFDYKKIN